MTTRPVEEVVGAAMVSTQAYLDFINEHSLSEPLLDVDHVKLQHLPVLIEGVTHYKYSCRFPPGQEIPLDSHGHYIPAEKPAKEIPTRLIEYNKRTGTAKLAFLEELVSASGQFRIDRRQKLKRWLSWFEKYGKEIGSIEDLDVPSLDLESARGLISSNGSSPNEEQLSAIETILSSKTTYICGPSGSGKTNYVLAKAVRALAAQGQKSLILGWSASAVDKALTAVLLEGINEKSVMFIGVPSPPFQQAYPQCCELQIFEQEMGPSLLRLRRLEKRQKALRQISQLASTLKKDRETLKKLTQDYKNKEFEHRDLQEQIRRLDFKAHGIHNELYRSKSKLTGERRMREELHVDEIDRELDSLQTELDFLKKTNRALESEKKSIRGLGGMLSSGKKKDIDETIANNKKVMQEIMQKIEDINIRKDLRNKPHKDLTDSIFVDETISDSMAKKLNSTREKLAELRPMVKQAEKDLITLQTEMQPLTHSVRELTARYDRIMKENKLSSATKLNNEIAIATTEITRLNKTVKEYKLNLDSKKVFGMTLDAFIGFSIRDLVKVDWIFLDEAACAPVVKVLPALALKRPLAMLGDGRQIPPACECHNEVIEACWGQSAQFLEELYRHGSNFEHINNHIDPDLESTVTRDLPSSYRFDEHMAKLLGKHIYPYEVKGLHERDAYIWTHHCEPYAIKKSDLRTNESEAEEIIAAVQIVAKNHGRDTFPSLAIVTPYQDQVDLIKIKLNEYDKDLARLVAVQLVQTSHGQSWDDVFFSVVDTNKLPGFNPENVLTCSNKPIGKDIMYTTIALARKRIVFFLDRTFWASSKKPCLLTELLQTEPTFEFKA